MLDGAPLNSHRNGVYRYYWFRVHWGRGSGSPPKCIPPFSSGKSLGSANCHWPGPSLPGPADFGCCPWCRPGGGLCEGLSIVGNVPSPTGRGNTKSPGVLLDPVCDTLPVQGKKYDNLWLRPRMPRQGRRNRHAAEPADAPRRRWRRRRPYPPGHHHRDRDAETGPGWSAGCLTIRRRLGGKRAGPAGSRHAGVSWSRLTGWPP